jgi:fumarate hydratase subunit beta
MKISLQDLLLGSKILKAGQRVFLSGVIYTARDAAHKRIIGLLDNGDRAPFDLRNAAIYYCGPAPAGPGAVIGACGPTTSARMDFFTPRLLKEGVKFLIGKGARSEGVVNSLKENNAVYFAATGGVAALLSKSVKKADLIAFEDLGPEAVYRLEVKDMPLIVAIDSSGSNIFRK